MAGPGIHSVNAIYNPLSVSNNIFGVHILDTSEVFEAAKLVNSQGGEWGYVTIPIRSDDRDKFKWISFMNNCRQTKLIPIIRISSYASGPNWVSPRESELTDFANFLNDLPWPVKNRYIVVYNEPNHSQEWGGYVSPSEYARTLVTAYEIFKSRSQDFFVISAGLDMSAPNSSTSLDALQYIRQMTKANNKWYENIDGLAVHAYPNPGFSASVWSTGRFGITSYKYEMSLLKSLGYKQKPVFITETGYIGNNEFYSPAYTSIWTDDYLVAITPFVLFAGAGEYAKFSLLDPNHQPKNSYHDIYNLKKVSGSPLLNISPPQYINRLTFSSGSAPPQNKINFVQRIINFLSPPTPTVSVNNVTLKVEIAEDSQSRMKGLSNRKSLDPDWGMLFISPDPFIQTFWMKDMLFPLDFIWINDGKVVNLHENIPPPSSPDFRPIVISSAVPVDQVLEVNSGFIAKNKIKIGDKVVVNFP